MWILFYSIIFLVLLFVLRAIKNKKILSFSWTVFLSVVLGLITGSLLQMHLGTNSKELAQIVDIISIVGEGYVKLLTMLVMPLIAVSLFTAIFTLKLQQGILKKTLTLIIVLVSGSLIGAVAGASMSLAFDLNAQGMIPEVHEVSAGKRLENKLSDFQSKTIPQRIVDMIPSNPFAELTGAKPTSMIGVVIFTILFGIAALQMRLAKPERYEIFKKIVINIRNIVNKLAKMIILLTPYGVFALMIGVSATQDISAILQLVYFIVASYAALIIVLVIFLIILALIGLNPWKFLWKSMPVFVLAFVTRSSAGALPMTYATQKQLGVSDEFASLASSLGISIGQAGCAGVFPAMLAVMIAPVVGINPLDPFFLLSVLGIIAIASFGVSSVGGGATFSALIVLPTLGLPVTLVGLLISIEPLIDMGRTALNVIGSIFSSVTVSRIYGELDTSQYNKPLDMEALDKDQEEKES